LEQNSVPKNEPDYFGFESAIEGMTDESGQNSAEENELDTFYSENTVKYRDGESGQNSVQKNKSDKKAKKTSNKWWQYKKIPSKPYENLSYSAQVLLLVKHCNVVSS